MSENRTTTRVHRAGGWLFTAALVLLWALQRPVLWLLQLGEGLGRVLRLLRWYRRLSRAGPWRPRLGVGAPRGDLPG